jgi:DNA-binding transcriptional MocR family regulator
VVPLEPMQRANPPRNGSVGPFRERVSLPISPLSALAQVLANWDDGAGHLYMRLAARLRAGVQTSQLLGGSRLPPERMLAKHLGVARNTIVRAYSELEAEGLVSRRQGSGTIVLPSSATLGGQSAELSSVSERNVVARLVAASDDSLSDLLSAHARLDTQVNEVVRAAIADCDPSEALRHPGYFPLGYPPLREAIAAHLSRRRLPSSPDQILVTSGAQQGISIVANGLARGRRSVVIEDPTFPGAIDSFRMAGSRLLTIPVTADGPDLERLDALLEDSDIGLAYLMPTHQNPTGVLMPNSARIELARLLEVTGMIVVEDDALAEIGLVDDVPIPVTAMAHRGIALSIGSLSKLFWGGLRIGWIRGPKDVIAQLGHVKASADLGTSIVSQAIAVRLLEQADRVRSLRQAEVAEGLECLEALLAQHLPSWSWRRPVGGLSLWVQLPHGSAGELARYALRNGVAIVPGSVMSPRGAFDDHLRLPIGRDPQTMAVAIRRLGDAWVEYEATQAAVEAPLRVVV